MFQISQGEHEHWIGGDWLVVSRTVVHVIAAISLFLLWLKANPLHRYPREKRKENIAGACPRRSFNNPPSLLL
jgi:hypothetical protein